MKKLTSLVLAIPSITWAAPNVENFDKFDQKDWQSGAYSQAEKLQWTVDKDKAGNSFLTKNGYAVYGFNVKNNPVIENGSVELKFNIAQGKEDPEAGIVWRFQDPKNYLYLRANSLEKNLVFYRMRDGKKELVKEAQADVTAAKWHTLKVVFSKTSVQAFLDDKEVLSLKDSKILKAGKVGVWSTADTQAYFDDLKVAN